MKIESGTGNGYEAEVSPENHLQVDAVAIPHQGYVSREHHRAFQASAAITIAASKVNLLLITNNSDLDLTVSYIRLMSIGAAAASETSYFTVEGGGSYTSGGDVNTPVNMNIGQNTLASVSIYDGGTAIVAADFTEFDRNYEANSMQSYNKDGALVLKRGASIMITHTGSTVAGTAYCRVSFYYEEN